MHGGFPFMSAARRLFFEEFYAILEKKRIWGAAAALFLIFETIVSEKATEIECTDTKNTEKSLL